MAPSADVGTIAGAKFSSLSASGCVDSLIDCDSSQSVVSLNVLN